MQQEHDFKMFTTRWKCLPAALLGGLFLLLGVAMLPSGRATGLSFAAAFGCGAVGMVTSFYGWYYVLTPVPVLRVDGSGLSHQSFPLVIQRVRWEDVSKLTALKRRLFIAGSRRRVPMLTMYITLTPGAIAAFGGHGRLIWQFSYADLPVPAEEVVQHIRRFHGVDYDDQFNRS